MHNKKIEMLHQNHDFTQINSSGEKRTLYVLILTAVTMLVEIVAGTLYGSMALLADGWHMSTHVMAFLIALFAYSYTRKHADDPKFSFGTGKVSVLSGFSSAIALGVVAFIMMMESFFRIINPEEIFFDQAILVAIIGLIVNIVSAWLLKDHHAHDHHHHEGSDHNHDHNLYAAYMHVLADALTSVLAIVALVAGKYYGWGILDPLMGVVGAVIISVWALGLIRETYPILLDNSIDDSYKRDIISSIEDEDDNKISDIHIWKVGPKDYAAIVSIVTHNPKDVEYYKSYLQHFKRLSHITIEVNRCDDSECNIS